MDIPALQAFLAAADTGSFSAAAERVFLTQPGISKRIAALEQELGTRLFDRIGRGIQLTEAGRALSMRARTVVSAVEDAKRALANLSGHVSGTLALATSHHIGLHRIPEALKRFHQHHPEVRLDLHFMDSEIACEGVWRGELELGIVTLPPAPIAGLQYERIWNDPLEIVVAPTHALTNSNAILNVKELLAYPAILPGPGTYTRGLILKSFGKHQTHIRTGMTTNYLEVLKMLASIGLGWSALPQTMIDESLKVVQIKNIRLRRELGIVTHAHRTLSNAGRALIDTIREAR